MEPTGKKTRRLPEVLVAQPQVGQTRSKPQLPPQHHLPIQQIQQQHQVHQPYHFQQPKRASVGASQAHHFYQQVQQQQPQPPSQQQPRMHQLQLPQMQSQQAHQQTAPVVRRLHGQHHYVKKGDELFVDLSVEREAPSQTSATSTWSTMLPASLTMPLHPVSPGFSALANSATSITNPAAAAGPVRRVGAKRVAGPDDWRLTPAASPTSYTPPTHGSAGASGAPLMVSPATYAGPVNVTVNNISLRTASPAPSPSPQCPPTRASPLNNGGENPSRAAAIEKRKLMLKQVTAAYEAELEAACQRLLALQREWREECERESAKENGITIL